MCVFFFKQKTAYEMRIRYWSSDVCASDLMAIVMAQLGGIGVLHRNLSVEEQADAVRAVKRFESGMVVNPITITPNATLADAQMLMTQIGRASCRERVCQYV